MSRRTPTGGRTALAVAALALALSAAAAGGAGAAKEPGPGGAGGNGGAAGGGGGSQATQTLDLEVPAHALDVVLGRPGSTSLTVSVLAAKATDAAVAYRRAGAAAATELRTATRRLLPGTAGSFALTGLQPDAPYTYRVLYGSPGKALAAALPAAAFRTARGAGTALIAQFAPEVDFIGQIERGAHQRACATAGELKLQRAGATAALCVAAEGEKRK